MEYYETPIFTDISQDIEIPTYSGALAASGFQAPGEEFACNSLDIKDLLPKDQPATYFMQCDTNDWENAHILSGDILVIDTSRNDLQHLSLVVCTINGEQCLRRICYNNSIPYLTVDKNRTPPVPINPEDDFQIFGEVVSIFRRFSGIEKIV